MSITAQGTAMKCDHPQCSAPATVEEGAWGYCAQHAGKAVADTKPVEVRPRPDLSRAHTPPVLCATAAAKPTGIGLLLEQASAHSSNRVRRLAERIETQLDGLRTLVASLAEEEQRKQAEAAAKEKARADVLRLEQELAAARAVLRSRKDRRPRQSSAPADRQWPCRKGCDRTYGSTQGRGKHERSCTGATS